jgi:uncharacterized protein (DUF1778 family)
VLEGRYDKDMIDTDTVKLSWLFVFERIKTKYEELLARLESPAAHNAAFKELASFLRP